MVARLEPFTVDGFIRAASMVILNATRHNQRVPRLAAWSLGAGIVATIGATVAHDLGHDPIGALVGTWRALALVGSFELLMTIIRGTPPLPGDMPEAHGVHAGVPATEITTRASPVRPRSPACRRPRVRHWLRRCTKGRTA
jgi:hypothetical protein